MITYKLLKYYYHNLEFSNILIDYIIENLQYKRIINNY